MAKSVPAKGEEDELTESSAAAITAVDLNAENNGYYNGATITAVDTHAEDNDFYDGDNDDGAASYANGTQSSHVTDDSSVCGDESE
ncbi:hypothetical protein JAAARDRAFT_201157 [Jaapia argillacea MUCL 33604]|uniref:Uncharacterized protein n=1 Tax=Jaapia argillacea MUCL 33604 TaxID=933084 RepID=A0A067PDH5_9AGAM|nr:hypothetical protein JAAARDRAFT_201157 [Jaapia argillacea MUCL 33604]